ncbi:MAG: serine/threonine-protein phosphatase [Ignavibacteria bacterium]|mgnify:CR=1 FL=1|nr:serine/threonine-protein phosphatase [Ignavibacteria bacterium]
MNQKKTYRLLETVTSKHFDSDQELLEEAVMQIINNSQFEVDGARIWILDIESASYRLLFQMGNTKKIDSKFSIKIKDYSVFEKITNERTVLTDETDETLRKKGIFKYSATGIGDKAKIDGKRYYQYLLAVNSKNITDDLRYTLNIIAAVLTSRLKERHLSIRQKDLIEDLDKAKQLQRSILPEHEYKFHQYEMFGVTLPANIIGGDFFDYVRVGNDEERVGIAVGDAASKGISAAAEAMYISGALRMASTFQLKISPFMYRLNKLVNKIFSDDKFVSLFYGELSNDKRGLFLYANAGHNPPVYYSREKNKTGFLEVTGPLLGPTPNAHYETASHLIGKGDLIVIYSDGIVEAANEHYDFYQEERLLEFIKKNNSLSPKELALRILEDVLTFSTKNSQYQDDKTIVVIKRNDAD